MEHITTVTQILILPTAISTLLFTKDSHLISRILPTAGTTITNDLFLGIQIPLGKLLLPLTLLLVPVVLEQREINGYTDQNHSITNYLVCSPLRMLKVCKDTIEFPIT